MPISLRYEGDANRFAILIRELRNPVAKAATAAVKEAAAIVKRDSKAALSSAGFSVRGSNAMRVRITPKSGDSIDMLRGLARCIRRATQADQCWLAGAHVTQSCAPLQRLCASAKARGCLEERPMFRCLLAYLQ